MGINDLKTAARSMDREMFDTSFLSEWTPEQLQSHSYDMREMMHGRERGPRWMPSTHELWTIESYVIQKFDYDQGDFHLEFVYPVASKELQIVPLCGPKRGEDVYFMVVGAYADGDIIANIEIEVGIWDGKYRLQKLWHDDDEEVDPAEVLDAGEEKWVMVELFRDRRGEVKSNRGKRTTYRAAGGPGLDPRRNSQDVHVRGASAHFHEAIDERSHWQEVYGREPITGYDTYRTGGGPIRPASAGVIGHSRRFLDRAHADEMMGESASEGSAAALEWKAPVMHSGGTVTGRMDHANPNPPSFISSNIGMQVRKQDPHYIVNTDV